MVYSLRLLDIDFECYMLMKGLTKQEYKNLNNDEVWKSPNWI